MLHIDCVSVRRGSRIVLDTFSMTVNAGQTVALIGRNGCGKSTLISAVAGVLQPTHGAIVVDGFSVWGNRRSQRCARSRLGYVPENSDAPDFMTSAELIALAAASRQCELPTANVRELLSLDEIASLRLDQMSLGQRRRALLGAAFSGPPKLLVLDEPDNGLDTARLHGLAQLLKAHATHGGATLLASHDQTFADMIDAQRLSLDDKPS
jgi:ABC-2 type transport system ATP-binding protein